MGNWRSRRALVLGLGMVGLFAAGVVTGLLWLWYASEEPPALHTDRSVEESLLDGALAEIDRPILQARYQDDLDSMLQRRVIRILTTYNKTNFFIADGRLRGFEYELLQQYRAYLKTRVRKRSWPSCRSSTRTLPCGSGSGSVARYWTRKWLTGGRNSRTYHP